LLGRAGNNPYCHHRALELARQGLRERVVQVEKAPGTSFDHGRFELVVESADESSAVGNLVQITSLRGNQRKRKSKELIICRNCDRHVFARTRTCPFCEADVAAHARIYEKNLKEARKAYQRLLKLLPQ
jgi:lipopolysaccharide biosynthesis regulator YciM